MPPVQFRSVPSLDDVVRVAAVAGRADLRPLGGHARALLDAVAAGTVGLGQHDPYAADLLTRARVEDFATDPTRAAGALLDGPAIIGALIDLADWLRDLDNDHSAAGLGLVLRLLDRLRWTLALVGRCRVTSDPRDPATSTRSATSRPGSLMVGLDLLAVELAELPPPAEVARPARAVALASLASLDPPTVWHPTHTPSNAPPTVARASLT